MHQDVVSGWQLPPNIRSLKNDANAIRRMLRSKGLEELMDHNTETDYAKVTKLPSTSYLLLFSNTDLDWSNCLSFCMFISPSCWLAVYGTCGKMIISLWYAKGTQEWLEKGTSRIQEERTAKGASRIGRYIETDQQSRKGKMEQRFSSFETAPGWIICGMSLLAEHATHSTDCMHVCRSFPKYEMV